MLLPKTRAYYEIWLDEEKIADKKDEEDPLYQDRYLPRKFKIAIAIPPNNDVDVFANDIGLIAIIENEQLERIQHCCWRRTCQPLMAILKLMPDLLP